MTYHRRCTHETASSIHHYRNIQPSDVLAWSIRSALRSTFADRELIVVGDCCTDDTEDVVSAFRDPRIRFVNFDTNYGEQSVPNNVRYSLARAPLIAYLNHDDIWLEDHLALLVRAIEHNRADLVYSMLAVIDDKGRWRLRERA